MVTKQNHKTLTGVISRLITGVLDVPIRKINSGLPSLGIRELPEYRKALNSLKEYAEAVVKKADDLYEKERLGMSEGCASFSTTETRALTPDETKKVRDSMPAGGQE